MSDIYRAVEILCHNGGCLDAREMVEVGSKLAEMGSSPKERFDAGYRYYDNEGKLSTQEEREALFMSVLESRLGVNKANGDGSGLSLIDGAAAEVMRCFEERERHGWAYQSFDYRDGTERFVDFTTESEAFERAKRQLRMLLHSALNEERILGRVELEKMREKLAGQTVLDGHFELSAKVWMKNGKERVYVDVAPEGGGPRSETLFIENGEIHWKYPPKDKSAWMQEIENAVRNLIFPSEPERTPNAPPLLDVVRDGCRLVVDKHPSPVPCPTLKEDMLGDFLFFHGFRKYGFPHGSELSGSVRADRGLLDCRPGDILVPIVAVYDHLEAVDTRGYTAEQLNDLVPEGYCRIRRETAETIFKDWTPDQIAGAAASYANGMAYALSAYIGDRVFRMALTYDTGTTEQAPDPVYAPPPYHHSFQGYPDRWLSTAVSDAFGEEIAELFADDVAEAERLYIGGDLEREEREEEPAAPAL